MKITPLNGYCVIRPLESEEKSEGGIIIPDSAKENIPSQGTVVAVATENITSQGINLPIEVNIGDRVLFGRFAGEQVEVDKEEYKIVELSAIHAIVRKDNEE